MARALVFTTDTVALRDPAGGPVREYRLGTPDGEGRIILTPVDQVPTPQQVKAFRRAWHTADSLGLKGDRVRHGLFAALNAWRRP
ncbi:hypothetical protein SEA_CHILIPEPPER_56 [Microbacterium phage ChiliPepper]|nr:hypothetical protein SEA_CHILIPEPPER_56 [Microbacterium phage ChiliPepper]